MMHEEHGEGVPALKFAQVGQERCDLPACVLIDAVQAHEGIEHQKPRGEGLDGALEAFAIALEVEPQGRGGDHLHIERGELAAGRLTDALKARAHDVLSVLGREQQHTPRSCNREAPQRRPPGSHRNRKVEREEALAALRFPTDDTDRPFAPEAR